MIRYGTRLYCRVYLLSQVVPSPKSATEMTKAKQRRAEDGSVATSAETDDHLAAESEDTESTPGSSLQPVSLHMTQESQLSSTEPVYAGLMDCPTPVKAVLHRLTTAPW